MRTFLPVAAVLAAATAARAGDASPWIPDYDAAAAKAKAEGKHLLVDFTGSDWCHWCKKLDGEVFSKEEFLAAAQKHFVLVMLDFPNGEEAKAKVPNAQRNQELLEKHGVQGFPSVLLLTADGRVIARTGYREGGAAPYVAFLDKVRGSYDGAVALAKEYRAASAEARPALLEKALAGLEAHGDESAGDEELASVAKDALAEGTPAAMQERAVGALSAAGQADAAVHAAAKRLDPKNDKGLLEKAVLGYMATVDSLETCRAAVAAIEDLDAAGPMKDEDHARTIYVNAMFWNHRFLNDAAAAKKYALKLRKVGHEDPRINALMDMILGDDDPAHGDDHDHGDHDHDHDHDHGDGDGHDHDDGR